jgi:protein TonB
LLQKKDIPPPPPKVDQVKFVKPVLLAEEVTEEPKTVEIKDKKTRC